MNEHGGSYSKPKVTGKESVASAYNFLRDYRIGAMP